MKTEKEGWLGDIVHSVLALSSNLRFLHHVLYDVLLFSPSTSYILTERFALFPLDFIYLLYFSLAPTGVIFEFSALAFKRILHKLPF